ncbi:hemolysin family protein [Puniceibacterium sp. IMCC21224]|uniref:hemolysin family protein n=1 Tax=Puniceibacterium sp. IMCC21224 TaxID=1618204 RepID=UPI00064E1335|nr:hemolysin family protein [Puniceibacterium sp. IMCC21224]KMK68900.1 CBS domain-containing protein [Puniceibacterium sp. IMCC21224]
MDESDGSSNAAPGARETEDDTKAPGFFRRIVGVLSPTDSTGSETNGSAFSLMPLATHGMMNLRRMRVEDVSIPKAEIVAVPDTITKDELVKVFRTTGMTRLPVYSGTLDTPIGMAHLKDFALMHGFNGGKTPFDLAKMARPLLFVPPSMPIGVLLTKMQTERRHMALVIDEYGGVDGLVTIEDLIEQVIGDIEDEHDTDEGEFWKQEKAGCYLAQAKTPLDEFEAEIGMQLTDDDQIDAEEIDTLGGLVFVLSGHVPARGEMVPHPSGVEFEVVDADPRRIKRLRVRMPGSPGTAAATATAAAKGTVEAGRA